MSQKNVCDEDVYESLFYSYSDTLRNFLYYKCGDIQQAEDIIQDTFIKLWNNCAKVIYEKAKSYLYTIANNAFLNEVAHKKVVLQHQKLNIKNSTNETPEFLMEEEEFMEKLNKAIADLPHRQREVFLLSRIDKKKYSEIADIVGISIKAVEKRMSQALLVLRDKIGDI